MNWNHKACKIAVVGMSGSGKTTYFCRYVSRTPTTLKFIFDGDGELSHRLHYPPATTPGQLLHNLSSGIVCFDPCRMYPGDLGGAFRFFCDWSFAVASRYKGRKLFACDELSKWCEPNAIPWEFKNLMETGRRVELDVIFICQRPQDIAPRARQQITEYVALKQGDNLPAEFLEKKSGKAFRAAELLSLPAGRFVSITDTGKATRGKIF